MGGWKRGVDADADAGFARGLRLAAAWWVQGKTFRPYTAGKPEKKSVSASSWKMEFRKFSVFSVLNLENSKKLGKNMTKN